jgi:hypothetical protein
MGGAFLCLTDGYRPAPVKSKNSAGLLHRSDGCHSSCNARIGSTKAARRAGNHAAINDVPSSTAVAAINKDTSSIPSPSHFRFSPTNALRTPYEGSGTAKTAQNSLLLADYRVDTRRVGSDPGDL